MDFAHKNDATPQKDTHKVNDTGNGTGATTKASNSNIVARIEQTTTTKKVKERSESKGHQQPAQFNKKYEHTAPTAPKQINKVSV